MPAKQPADNEISREIERLIKRSQSRYTKDDRRSMVYWANRTAPASQFELDFRHAHWQNDRDKVKAAFDDLGVTESRKSRFCECGSEARVLVSEDGKKAKVVSNQCHDRVCHPCGEERQRNITQNLLAYCQDKELRFITLTLKHSVASLANQIDRLYTCFNRLRERNAWKTRVKGGAVFFELKPNETKEEWHPHLHIIVESNFFPHRVLSAEWFVCTGDSYIIDIAYVRDKPKQLSYVAKYASKPIDPTIYDRPAMLKEAITALQGRRACMVIGTWRRTKKNPTGLKLTEKPKDKGVWIDVGSLETIVAKARAGDANARSLCQQLELNVDWRAPQHHDPPEKNPNEIPF